jgi:hypothetical protein
MAPVPQQQAVLLTQQFIAFVNGGRFSDALGLLDNDVVAFGHVGMFTLRVQWQRYWVRFGWGWWGGGFGRLAATEGRGVYFLMTHGLPPTPHPCARPGRTSMRARREASRAYSRT